MWFITPLLIIWIITLWIVSWLLIPALFLSVIIWFLSIKIVTPNTVKTVEFLWKYNRILRPWINFLIPFIEWTKHQDLYKKNFVSNVESISSDNVTVYVKLNTIYYVVDNLDDTVNWNIYKSIYSVYNFTQILESVIDEQLRALISTFDHKEIFSKRQEIWEDIERNLKEKLAQFWYTLDSIQVRDIKLEASVMSAMNRVVESLKLKEAALNEWEAEKIRLVKQAEADKDSKILIWQWMAWQRMEIAKWFRESVEMIKWADWSLDWDKILKFLLDSSRIETLNTIWNTQNSKLIYLNEDLEWRGWPRETKLIAWSDLMK